MAGSKSHGRIAIALSGGVDSAVAGARLLERGFEVTAIHLQLVRDISSIPAAHKTAGVLGLKLHVIDLTQEFERLVIEPFAKAYLQGETPNPCVLCNPTIKFGLMARWAEARGIETVATGHYAGLGPLRSCLVRPRDLQKDQTYFLCRLTRTDLTRVVFPLAESTKSEVRDRARALGLAVPEESQEICFLGGRDYREFLGSRRPDGWNLPGEFVDSEGKPLGRHRGIGHYTVGQRRGLGIPAPEPYYVLAIDPEHNRVVLGIKTQTFRKTFPVRDPIWSTAAPRDGERLLVQIRSRHRPAPARIRWRSLNRLEVEFEKPQSSIAAGQAAAFFRDRMLLGGGIIQKTTFDTQPPESF